ncbi:MAG: hypothetical protein M3Y91_08220 [Actinomycetota bacterium]|nr:hypothetical protein [Actinomycetota bacterium]
MFSPALVVAAGVIVSLYRSRNQAIVAARRATADRDHQVSRAEAERHAAVQAGTDAQRRVALATARADEADAALVRRTTPSQALLVAQGRLDALWGLSCLAADWERQGAERQSTASSPAVVTGDLAGLLEVEVGRIREEAGIPGMVRAAVEPPAAGAEALMVLRSVQLLLSALARHCQGYDLYVHRWEGRISAVVVCEDSTGRTPWLTTPPPC